MRSNSSSSGNGLSGQLAFLHAAGPASSTMACGFCVLGSSGRSTGPLDLQADGGVLRSVSLFFLGTSMDRTGVPRRFVFKCNRSLLSLWPDMQLGLVYRLASEGDWASGGTAVTAGGDPMPG